MQQVLKLPDTIKSIDKKSWFLGSMALFFTMLCSISLQGPNRYQNPPYIPILWGLLDSLFLNAGLWLCCFKTARAKLKSMIAFLILFSGLGVAIANPLGQIFSGLALLFHWWLIYDLIKTGETK